MILRFRLSYLLLFALLGSQTSFAAKHLIADGDVSALQQAVQGCNSSSTNDTIILWLKGTYTVPLPLTYIGSVPSLLVINKATGSLVIQGNGATLERSAGDPAARVLMVLNSTVTVYNTYIRNGNTNSSGEGAGILNTGGTLKLYNCSLSHCEADNGGALYAGPGTNTLLYSCTISACSADLVGSALYFGQSCNATLSNCTISGNFTNSSSGAALHYAESSLNAFVIQLFNSIVADNKTNDGTVNDIYGAVSSGGRNLVGAVMDTRTQTDFFPSGHPNSFRQDYVGTVANPKNPQLNAFALYAGLTPSMTLTAANATARDQARNASSPLYDQAGNNRVGNADIGSMEYTADANQYFPFLPVMVVFADQQPMTHQGTHVFADQETGGSHYVTVKIKDKIRSNANLNLLTTPSVFMEGEDAGEFMLVTDTLRTELNMGDSSGFQIYFTPKSAGVKTATVRIAGNDLTQPVYEFTVQGMATEPLATGVEEKESMAHARCFPNPVTDQLQVLLNNNNNTEILVADYLGKPHPVAVRHEEASAHLDCSSLAPGIYTVIIREDQRVTVERVVKK